MRVLAAYSGSGISVFGVSRENLRPQTLEAEDVEALYESGSWG